MPRVETFSRLVTDPGPGGVGWPHGVGVGATDPEGLAVGVGSPSGGDGSGLVVGPGVGVDKPEAANATSWEGGLSRAAELYAVTAKKYVTPASRGGNTAVVAFPTSARSVNGAFAVLT